MGSCDKSIAKCVEVANLVEGIEKAVMIKKLVTFVTVATHSTSYFE